MVPRSRPGWPRPGWPRHFIVVALCFAAVFIAYLDRANISVAAIAMKEQFGWTETQKGLVLSSFFVGYLVLQVASGWLANRYGGRIVLGLAVLWWSLFTLLTPAAALISLPMLIAARITMGLGEAAVFPAAVNMIARWVPVAERTRAMGLLFSGLSFGTLFALPATGWLVRQYGWPSAFYVFGAVGLVWGVAWFVGVRGEPDVNLEPETAGSARPGIPWRALLSTPGVWAITVNHFCHNWSLYLLVAWLPSYFRATYGLSITNAGLYSAAPWLTSFVMANSAAWVADRMLIRGVPTTLVRKLMQTIGLVGSAACLLLLREAGSANVALILVCSAAGALAITTSGFAPNGFDLAPRYADVIFGISNTFATIPGIVGVAVTGWLIDQTGSYAAPFLLAASISVVGALVFLIFGTGRRVID